MLVIYSSAAGFCINIDLLQLCANEHLKVCVSLYLFAIDITCMLFSCDKHINTVVTEHLFHLSSLVLLALTYQTCPRISLMFDQYKQKCLWLFALRRLQRFTTLLLTVFILVYAKCLFFVVSVVLIPLGIQIYHNMQCVHN